ncbi:hypothetical protein CDAR_417781 [Caerostris darwini]|uniref:Uncharacterized protein n=1 Tax=Caerostris darwini TaxID=1538125 RepID=A0AAV4PR07_9ARAC|nr:hypothetical protein CDAR_417781 [Caerostris darwini]
MNLATKKNTSHTVSSRETAFEREYSFRENKLAANAKCISEEILLPKTRNTGRASKSIAVAPVAPSGSYQAVMAFTTALFCTRSNWKTITVTLNQVTKALYA